MLVFFDIDATMITTGGVGIRAMMAAGRDLFGTAFTADGIPFAGRLDPVIMEEMLARNGVEVLPANLGAFRAGYRRRLEDHLVPGIGRALPGVLSLLDELEARDGVCLGVLTGNFADTGSMKLRACGIEPDRFAIQVWGDDSPHRPPRRDHLPGVGLDRYEQRHGRRIEPRLVTIIGDTPDDIACARAHGCRALAVATGQFSVAQLTAAGADRVVANLADTRDVMSWLVPPDSRL